MLLGPLRQPPPHDLNLLGHDQTLRGRVVDDQIRHVDSSGNHKHGSLVCGPARAARPELGGDGGAVPGVVTAIAKDDALEFGVPAGRPRVQHRLGEAPD